MSSEQMRTQAPVIPGLLRDKVAIITGASRGIGAETARAFSRAGATVVLAARNPEALESLRDELRTQGAEALAVATDVTDPAAVESLVEQTVSKYGRLDAAFNNAGGGHMPVALHEIAIDDFDRLISLNLRGVFLSMKYEIAAMLQTGGGSIVNMSSTAGLRGARGLGDYVAAKHGVVGLTQAAALDYAARDVRVNAVAPGPILNDRMASLSDEQRLPIGQSVPMGRIGRAEEVAATVLWLCSDFASFVTGVTLPIDGGQKAQ
jgi:NAD(P)-dependent dehydrogenase (short-subunit alcohol dehydrogenase family)